MSSSEQGIDRPGVALVVGFGAAVGIILFFPWHFPKPSPLEYAAISALLVACVARAEKVDLYFTSISRSNRLCASDFICIGYSGPLAIWWYLTSPPLTGDFAFKNLAVFLPLWFYFVFRLVYSTAKPSESTLSAASTPLDEVIQRCTERRLVGFGPNDIDYSNYSEQLIRILSKERAGSLTLGLTGRWGIGKSSIVEVVRGKLAANGLIVCYQSAWDYRNPTNILDGILKGLKDDVSRRAYIPEFEDFVRHVASQLLDEKSRWMVPLLPRSSDTTARDLAASIDEALRKANLQVILILDDIDRLDPQECAAVFRAIHLLSEFSRISKLIVYDRVRLSYFADPERNKEENFIQKVIDIELSIPTPSEEDTFRLYNYCTEPMDFSDEDMKRFYALFHRQSPKLFFNHLKTPRDIKRVALRVALVWSKLRANINLFDLFAISIIHEMYPTIYRTIFDRPHCFYHAKWSSDLYLTFGSKEQQEEAQEIRKRLQQEFPDALPLLAAIFPDVAANDRTKEPNPEEARLQRRIYHPDIFERYFRIDISGNLIPEVQLEDYAEQFISLDRIERIRLVELMFTKSAADKSTESFFKGWPLFENVVFTPGDNTSGTDTSIDSVDSPAAPTADELDARVEAIVIGIAQASSSLSEDRGSGAMGLLSQRNTAGHIALRLIARTSSDDVATRIMKSAVEASSSIGFCDGFVFYSCNHSRGRDLFRERAPDCTTMQQALKDKVERKYRDQLTGFFNAEPDERVAILYRLADANLRKQIISSSLSSHIEKFPVLLKHFIIGEFSGSKRSTIHQNTLKELLNTLTREELKAFLAVARQITMSAEDQAVLDYFAAWLSSLPRE